MTDTSIPRSLVEALRTCERITVLTGAGVSAESGIPTFRAAQSGMWAHFRPEELATPRAFRRNPKLVWEWYQWRRSLIAGAAPNPAHYAIAEMERHLPDFTLITQNVDGLHGQAGSTDPIELHGNITRNRCFEEGILVASGEEMVADSDEPPRCPRCGAFVRPDVVWFGESLPAGAMDAALKATHRAQAFFSVGTSTLVHPAAALPYAAIERGTLTVEVNPEATPLSSLADYTVRGPAGEVLPELVHRVWPTAGD